MIRDAVPSDAPAIAEIYNPFIRDTAVTFEVDPVTPDEIARRVEECRSAGYPFIVWEDDGQVAAYAYARPFGARAAFAKTAEPSVYMDPEFTGRRIGTRLYLELIERCRAAGMHLLAARVAMPNAASEALHAAAGFEHAGTLPQAGYKFGRYHDLAHYTLLLDEA